MKSNKEYMESILNKVDNYKIRQKRRNRVILSSICGLFLVVGISMISLKTDIVNNIIPSDNLPRFESEEQLLAMLKTNYEDTNYRTQELLGNMVFNGAIMEDFAESSTALKSEANKEMESADDSYSKTNTQVQGVDESDIVKTNGDYIYYLSNNVLRIFETKTEDTKLIKEIELKGNDYTYASELYINDQYIVVIASSRIANIEPIMENKSRLMIDYALPYGGQSSTKAFIYNINTYELEREIEIDGNYVSSRKVDNNFYIITNKYINAYKELKHDDIVPLYKDTIVNEEYLEIPVTDIRYFPDFDKKDCSYMLISSFNLDKIDNEVDIYTCLGAGNEIYASRENLYVTRANYEEKEYTTAIHKFEIKNGKVNYKATGNVPGTLLNQFSMDEYDGHFRITTTKGNTWDDTSVNNLYVLDDSLNIVGTLEGLAKGEKIYSTRFMGEKCYIVTYKTVDPLFVIDLSKPEKPTVLGELKIPGYSSYLHPLGENYLIGFGEDSVEKSYLNWRGETEVTAYATGLKMAIFDVTDYNNPKELYSIKIGARGSYSELLYNHKSLLFDEEKGIIAFPANLTEDAGFYDNGVPRYGKTIFNGALIYNISIEDGISLRGQVEHQLEGKSYKDGIQRILYIGDRLYTVSPNMLKVSDLETVEELDKLEINQ
ncbi:MAG: hypothetical protein E7314_07220 [Clostridiales bacterium]|nr:hypothetical protein [Clostridiales bacterium]